MLTVYRTLKQNWLTRKPDASAGIVTALMTFAVALGAVLFWSDFAGIAKFMAASKEAVFAHHEYWRAWTTLLVHADEKHLLGNLALFFVLGFFLTGYFGLVLIPLCALLFGGLINLVVLSSMPSEVMVIGASGIVYWMGGAWLVLYFLIETRRSLLQRFLRVGGVGLALFMPAEAFDPSISYQSHLWGFLFGILWGVIYFLSKKRPLRQAEVWETTIEEAGGALEDETLEDPNLGAETEN